MSFFFCYKNYNPVYEYSGKIRSHATARKKYNVFPQDPDLKAVEEFLEENDSADEPANCILEDLPNCSGGSSSKCCDNVGAKLKDIGQMVFGPRSSLKECGLLDQVQISQELNGPRAEFFARSRKVQVFWCK
jgi:hypothetical protein